MLKPATKTPPMNDADRRLQQAVQARDVQRVAAALAEGANPNLEVEGRSLLAMVSHGHDKIRCALIEAGAWQDDLRDSLVWAVLTRRAATVRALLAGGADVNVKTFSGTPLSVAASLGEGETCELLLKAGADPDAGGGLSGAIAAGHGHLVRLLLEAGAAPQRVKGPQPLAEAAERGDLEMMEALLVHGAQPDAGLPLLAAARAGQAAAVERLLAAGARTEVRDEEGRSVLDLAAGHSEVLQVLARRGVEVGYAPAEALLKAAETGDLTGLEAALAAGAAPDARDTRRPSKDQTALMLAAAAGHAALVERLLQCGAEVDARDGALQKLTYPANEGPDMARMMGVPIGRSALARAAEGGHGAVLEQLLQAGANPNLADHFGYAPLHLAVEAGHLEIVDKLLQAGADVRQLGPQKLTALHLAVCGGFTGLAEKLLKCGARVDARCRAGATPLMEAARRCDLATVRLLLEHKASARASSKHRGTVLTVAAGSRHYLALDPAFQKEDGFYFEPPKNTGCRLASMPEERVLPVVEELLAAGAEVNAPGLMGPPLAEAARGGHLQLCRRLLSLGADPGYTDGGKTLAEWAELYGHPEVARELARICPASAPPEPEPEPQPERWGRELSRPDFSQAGGDPGYLQAVEELAALCGSPAFPLTDLPGCFRFHVRNRAVKTEELQARFARHGLVVSIQGYREPPETLAIFPCGDFEPVIAAMGTNGANCGIGPGYIVDWLRELQAEVPFVLTCIMPDTLAGRFLVPIPDPKGMARKMFEFCPDLVEQGCQTVAALAKELKKSDQLFFWWD